MDKDEVLKKYRDLFEQVIFAAQRTRSLMSEMGEEKAGITLDGKLFNDDDPLNIIKALNLYLGKFDEGTITAGDIFNGITLINRSDVLLNSFEMQAHIQDYAIKEIPRGIKVMAELLLAGVD